MLDVFGKQAGLLSMEEVDGGVRGEEILPVEATDGEEDAVVTSTIGLLLGGIRWKRLEPTVDYEPRCRGSSLGATSTLAPDDDIETSDSEVGGDVLGR